MYTVDSAVDFSLVLMTCLMFEKRTVAVCFSSRATGGLYSGVTAGLSPNLNPAAVISNGNLKQRT